jgi:hypothetical protein
MSVKGKLKQFHWCLIFGLAKENQMKKNQIMSIWLNKIIVAQHFGKRCKG